MKKLFCVAIIILLAVSFSGLSYAAESASSDACKGAMNKAGRGLKNLLLGWTDIPLSIYQVTNESKNAALGLTAGAWDGFKKAFPRTISGAVDLATFPIPDYDKSPVKPDPLMEPSTASTTK
ncbi:MAG: exosortase system-associated protein, TIGR04073 family [Candidatus Omnitrophota bacterium]|nr:exosortase system-associated protein, TIGR04073 family [Candidatus Omnitrophota bacterium]